MGNTAVAVLHYDMMAEIREVSPRLARAMLDMPGSDKPRDFHFGQIVAWDHASGYQVVVVHGNTGWRLGLEAEVPPDAEAAVAEVLRLRGWKCAPPKSQG